jgi:hypothetical protein
MNETMKPCQFVEALFATAKEGKWDIVDNTLVPQLDKFDGNEVAPLLLGRVSDEDSHIRDVVATALCGLQINNEQIRGKVVFAMARMALQDLDMFPAGRAAVFCLKHQDDGYTQKWRLKCLMDDVICQFPAIVKTRVKTSHWNVDVLMTNIEDLKEMLVKVN